MLIFIAYMIWKSDFAEHNKIAPNTGQIRCSGLYVQFIDQLMGSDPYIGRSGLAADIEPPVVSALLFNDLQTGIPDRLKNAVFLVVDNA